MNNIVLSNVYVLPMFLENKASNINRAENVFSKNNFSWDLVVLFFISHPCFFPKLSFEKLAVLFSYG